MKKLLTFIFLFVLINTITSQSLNGYKYIYITPFSDNLGLLNIAASTFESEGFIVLNNLNSSPNDLLLNKCLALKCNIYGLISKGWAEKATVSLENCKNEIVYLETGSCSISVDDNDGTRKAVKNALYKLQYNQYSFNSNFTPEIEYPKVEQTNENEESLISYFDNNKIDGIEGIYKNMTNNTHSISYKIGIKKYGYKYKGIIIETTSKIWKIGEVKCIFEPTAVKNYYSAKFYMRDKTSIETFASLEHSAMLKLNIPSSNENVELFFIKLYPSNIAGSNSPNNNTSDENWNGNGSGIIISTDGYIVTNNHVIEDASEIEVEFKCGEGIKAYNAKVIKSDAINDLAIIQIDDSEFNNLTSIPYNFKTRSADVGTEVFALGYPKALGIMGKDIKFTDGKISSKTGARGNITTYQTTTPIQPGNSGGPLFDTKGNLIGINVAILHHLEDVEGVSYSIKSSYVLNLIDVLPNSIPIPSSTILSSKPLTEQIKVLSDYVVLIKTK